MRELPHRTLIETRIETLKDFKDPQRDPIWRTTQIDPKP